MRSEGLTNAHIIAILGGAAYDVYANTPKFDDVNWDRVALAVLSKLAEIGMSEEMVDAAMSAQVIRQVDWRTGARKAFTAALRSLSGGE